ncbi:hypothetical protein DEU39_4634 [Chryseobacterium sp. AG363]|nr:hypothetical protein DEU39_4634 [Chryseobacterium sp. AG363]
MILLLLLSIANSYQGQDFETGFPKPVASVSSLATYTNSPVSLATGIPDISFPLASLPTNSKDITAGIGISYHPKNLLSGEKASEVGLGWSLLGSNGVISREIIQDLDERYRDQSNPSYYKNEFNDIYYYNIDGNSGKFRIIRDITNNTFQLVKLTPSNLKIEYTRDSNTATLVFNSFTITDDRGYKYLFDKYSVSEFKGYGSNGIDYKSAFFLTKIYDYKMQELVSMDYQVDTYTTPISSKIFQNCKLKKIWSKDNGSIEFDYTYTASYKNSMNDPYHINSVIVKNNAGILTSKSEFLYDFQSLSNPQNYRESIDKRVLRKIKKYSADLTQSETTEFEYNTTGSEKEYSPIPGQFKDYFLCDFFYGSPIYNEIENPKYFPVGSLKKVKLPTGGAVEYNFEANEYAIENFGPEYISTLGSSGFTNPQIQYLKPVYSADFNTNVSKTYNFTVSGTANTLKVLYVKFTVDEIYPYDSHINPGDGSQPTLEYIIPDANYNDGQTVVMCTTETSPIISASKFALAGGAHTLKILSQTGGKGHFEMYEIALKDGPYKNAVIHTNQGVRIKSIKYFDSYSANVPVNTETFAYDMFNDPNTSSGENIPEGNEVENVVYKNVKVFNGNTSGYTLYYFKTPSAYPKETVPSDYQFWPNINITQNGLMGKKEIYDNNNLLLASEEYDYTLQDMDTPKYIPIADGSYKTKTAWIKEQRLTSKVYDKNARTITTSTESINSAADFNLISEKSIHSDGTVLETSYQYAREKNNTALMAANILGLPLETQLKKNGTLLSKNEIKYDNAAALYPTSVLAFTPDNPGNSYTGIRYDIYDEKGNIVQYTTTPDSSTGVGNPSTIIWGYNKTKPIAKIDGAKLSDIPQSLITSIVNASNEDANASTSNAQVKEDALLAQLEIFKNHTALAGFSVIAYTYNPLVGVTNVLPPNGIRELYFYDSFGRLEKVKDVNGKTLKEYKYNYKQ